MSRVDAHRAVQAAAKRVLSELGATLSPLDSERSLVLRAREMLAGKGITETWYYDCPALVLAGARTCLSLSGKDYEPSEDEIGLTNLVTVDLSPSVGGVWGDCARSFYVEEGIAVEHPQTAEFLRGQEALNVLHEKLKAFATPEMMFEDLCGYASSQIASLGFVNLDFLGNVGHTIEADRALRRYVEPGNKDELGSASLFTFEPHIRAMGGVWGFKHEEIYYFHDDRLCVL